MTAKLYPLPAHLQVAAIVAEFTGTPPDRETIIGVREWGADAWNDEIQALIDRYDFDCYADECEHAIDMFCRRVNVNAIDDPPACTRCEGTGIEPSATDF